MSHPTRPYLYQGTHRGHDHFWDRARALSRRQFLGTTAGAAAAAATSPLWMPILAEASNGEPVPIPPNPGFLGFRVSGGPGQEPSSIFNFSGVVGVAMVGGVGIGTDGEGNQTSLIFDSDNRFMQGEYIAVDGRRHEGTFAFV
jgi:hypothetical protein